jgi:hypothetical protein
MGVIAITLSVAALMAHTTSAQETSPLKLEGVRLLDYGRYVRWIIGFTNVSDAPIRAFRVTLLRSNDFNETIRVFPIEYSSESEFRTAPARGTGGHIIKPGETIYYVSLASLEGGERFFTNNPGRERPSAIGPFSIKVTQVVNDE